MIETNCGYVVENDTVCSGSRKVEAKFCRSCPIYEKSTFYAKYPTQTVKKTAVIKIHAFGVTVKPRA